MRVWRAAALLSCLALGPVLPGAAGPANIAVVARADDSPFWQAVERGALEAGQDLGVAVTFTAPTDEPRADGQAQLLENALAANPAALCIDALDSSRILPLLQKARRARIPIIGFGQGAAGPLALATAAADNAAAAALAANKLGAYLDGAGTVGIILGDPAARANVDRRDGFLRELRRRYPGIRVAAPAFTGGDPAAAAAAVKALLGSEPALRGLFVADEDSAAAALPALQEAGAAGRIVVIGFDSGSAQVDAVRSGLMAGAVTRDPVRLGYRAVAAAVDALNGRRLPAFIDTGFHWYDRTNIDDPSIAAILHP